jgi:hypothetical protein
VRPSEEILVVLELDRMPTRAEHEPRAIDVVFRDREAERPHERMFAYLRAVEGELESARG